MARATALGLAAVLGACEGAEHASQPASDSGGIDTLEGSGTAVNDDDDALESSGADSFFDLGQADDGAGGELECDDDPPEAFQIPIDASCKSEPQIGTFMPVVEWERTEWTQAAGSKESATMPIVTQLDDDDLDGDIDTDDVPDVLALTYGSGVWMRGLDGATGDVVLDAEATGFSRGDGIAVADIDGDGEIEIVGVDDYYRVVAFEHDGTMKWMTAGLGGNAPRDTCPAFGDMDGDGTVEIVAGRTILAADGTVIGTGTFGVGTNIGDGALSFPADVDGDGTQEVVVGNALYRMDGSEIWSNAEGDGFPAIADFDGDGDAEITVVRSGHVRLQNGNDGTVVWTTALPSGNGGPPTVADFDGDGHPEVGVASLNAYSVFDGDGTMLWTNGTQDISSGVTGSSVFDFEGDGISEIVYADETRLWVFAGNDGGVKLEYDGHSSGTRLEYPSVADVDGDGHAEIIVAHEHYQTNHVGVTVIGDANDSWRPARALWNQHAYHISHISDDGTVPAAPQPSWQTHNSFRAGDLLPNDGLAQPDLELFGTPCDGCAMGSRIVWIQLGNGGAGPLMGGATLQIVGVAGGVEHPLMDVPVLGAIAAGEVGDAIPIEVDPLQYEAVRVRAVAGELECDPTEATFEIAIEPCPITPPAG
ncbi:MAG TPA: VCBS repeat-containing protein [Nannocystaceae bacterium]|nr:VCBS repeat-containing protein [Nannocystaceae bacterium]